MSVEHHERPGTELMLTSAPPFPRHLILTPDQYLNALSGFCAFLTTALKYGRPHSPPPGSGHYQCRQLARVPKYDFRRLLSLPR
jgi:hypothetical protein